MEPEDFWLDEEEIRIEKNKGRLLRQSQWWKNLRAHNRCYYCGQQVPAKELTMDHIVPIARGGVTTKGNVVPACRRCNTEKKLQIPAETILETLH